MDGQELTLLKRLHLASLVEGSTLAILVCVAVPLKHLAGYPQVTAMMGPIHGLAFLFYAWMVINTASGGMWRKAQVARLLILAFIPFGTFFNVGTIKRRAAGPGVDDAPAKEKRI
ncbi:DUF3817 domain-containing protein [Enterobacteriales bacterium SAP-6]|uniref:DUF3817 domain-containing protein n=1 Tax=Acerihabitans arboris TaxID=2691583 RepID=A0A845SG19_9GAMM|nr:DUF3817 domain-containing protein [Acerihabitans arboris]